MPDYPVTVMRDQVYRENDKAALLDVCIPEKKPNENMPIVIWTHGGAWLSGDKRDAGPYYARLADQGYVVVSVNYSLAPNKKYPTAIPREQFPYTLQRLWALDETLVDIMSNKAKNLNCGSPYTTQSATYLWSIKLMAVTSKI